ncbi:CLUMA_CG002258, isoform A [Clunio marinus]|uniref:peptidylprolyl isomerase n=1 Tax=Clunio marinus TaxID=568069 RepID=A0A1J1HLT6_9DIPT|nr:CLUMA_CG002258, isoform A [Clunio marinus]
MEEIDVPKEAVPPAETVDNEKKGENGVISEVVHFSRTSKKRKKSKKIPRAKGFPKYYRNGYVRYCDHVRPSICTQNPTLDPVEITRLVASKWVELTKEERQPYLDEAKLDKERFKNELKKFNELHKGDSIEINATEDNLKPKPEKNTNILEKNCDIPKAFVGRNELPIFTDVFLDHNKTIEIELKALRRNNVEIDQHNSVLMKHIENMENGVKKIENEVMISKQQNNQLEMYLTKLKIILASGFHSYVLPTMKTGATVENIEAYMTELCSDQFAQKHPAIVNKARLILKSNKKYTQTLEKSFHLSQASLDHSSSDNDPVQVMYVHDENSYLLCTLQKGKVYQCPLDLNFQEGDKLCFSTKGNGIVHLTGFLTDEFDDFGDGMGELDDEESELEEMPDLRRKLEKKKKTEKETPVAKKSKQQDSDEDEDDEEEEDDSDAHQADGKDSDDEEEEDSDEEDDSDEEEESEEEEQSPPKKQQKLDTQQNNKKEKLKNGNLENGNKKQQEQQQSKKGKGEEGKLQKLQGGLLVQDLKVGSGAEAKQGKRVQVYYEGRLKTNNKVFDSTKSGPGFKFSLGRGEVIRAWDIGVAGMKVGGKRRLVCPPQLAYGAKGNPPVIPQNSTLVFDVELKNVL